MSFSKVTLQIMTRLQRWRAAGDPDADRKLAEHIEAALGNQPLPSYSDGKPTARAEAPMVLDRRTVIEECWRRACRKIVEGRSLDEAEENAVLFRDMENL
jgi:hypothetical protein